MKQFLHTSGPAIVAALNQHAYAVIPIHAVSEDGAGGGDCDKVHVVKLNAPTASSSSSQSNNKINNSEEQFLNAVQAISSKWKPNEKELICAVSRYDKFVSIYSISVADNGSLVEKEGEMVEVEVNPIVVHKTNKRCCALTFADIPHGEGEKDDCMDIIITGDLAGDVNAFPVKKASMADGGDNNDTTIQRRLLLGHTASMLTSVTVADGKLFSSDRDEKVRISSFPKTYVTEGYLLGHEAYITDLTVLLSNEDEHHVVTASGDSTIRLWDYSSGEELARYDVSPEKDDIRDVEVPENNETKSQPAKSDDDRKSGNSGTSGGDACDDQDGDGIQSSSQDNLSQNSQIPVRVSSNGDGSIIAVIYNEKPTVDLFSVRNQKLERVQSIDCNSTPLAVRFCQDNDILTILLKEPSYMARYKNEASDYNHLKYSVMQDCAIISSIKKVGQKLDIQMPASVLEVDETTGKIKVMKKILDESEGFVKHEPWMRGERVQMKKEKARRRKKRKLEEKYGGPPPSNAGI